MGLGLELGLGFEVWLGLELLLELGLEFWLGLELLLESGLELWLDDRVGEDLNSTIQMYAQIPTLKKVLRPLVLTNLLYFLFCVCRLKSVRSTGVGEDLNRSLTSHYQTPHLLILL